MRTCTVVTQYVKNWRWSSISSSCSCTALVFATERFTERLQEIKELIQTQYNSSAFLRDKHPSVVTVLRGWLVSCHEWTNVDSHNPNYWFYFQNSARISADLQCHSNLPKDTSCNSHAVQSSVWVVKYSIQDSTPDAGTANFRSWITWFQRWSSPIWWSFYIKQNCNNVQSGAMKGSIMERNGESENNLTLNGIQKLC